MDKIETAQSQSQFQVYNASAGSGKTFTLVKEYLKIILRTTDVFRFQNILAITFTNKAASEMKERVLKSLQDFSEEKQNPMLEMLSAELKLSEEDLMHRSKKVLAVILQNYGAFNITTIDSFTYRIIRSFAFDLGLSLNFDVEMDAGMLLDEAVDVLISKIGQDKALTEVLIAYSIEKADDDKSWDISRDLKEFSRVLLNENHFAHLNKLKDKSVDDYIKLKQQLNIEINQLKTDFIKLGKEGLSIIENSGLEHKDFYSSMLPKHFLNLANGLGKAKFFDQSKLKERIEEQTFYAKSKSEEIKETIESILPSLLGLYDKSEKLYSKYVLNNLVLKSLIPLAVLNQINKALDEIKEQNNIRLNAEFNQLISDEIRNEPAPFIYERIGEKFRYYFIDEMQDTSELQWKNLIPLIENALSSESEMGERGSLMLVGDAKQAIYRWRGGRAEQFIELSQENDKNEFTVKSEIKNLDTNYRSTIEIVKFNNDFFTYVSDFLGKDEYRNMYKEGSDQKTFSEVKGYVQVSLLNIDKKDPEKDLVYPKKVRSIIENLDDNFDRKDVCVLVRTKKQGISVSDYLTQHNIPIISSETLLLKNDEVVEFLIYIFTIIYNPSDKKAIANALYFLGTQLNETSNIHHLLDENVNKPISEIFEPLVEFGFNFNEKEFVKLPFYDGVEYALRGFNLLERTNLYVQSFLDVVLEYEQKRGYGLNDFLEYWERKKDSLSVVLPEGQDAVQIMTIHKSKGLEFPIVIFPYDLEIYKEQNPKIWFDNLKTDAGMSFESSLLDYSKKIGYISSYGETIYNQRREEIQLDNLNLLYVALTRPVEQLYVISKNNDKYKDLGQAGYYSDLFLSFLNSKEVQNTNTENEVCFEFGDKTKVVDVSESSNDQKVVPIFQEQFISNSWLNRTISIATNASKLWDTEQGNAIEYGNLIHFVLSQIKWAPDVDGVLEKLLLEGHIGIDEVVEITAIVKGIINHKDLFNYYQPNSKSVVMNEKALVSGSGKIQVPDRVWIAEGKAVIIDYKTGVQKEDYRNQINEYALTYNEMGYEIEKKLLVYIDSKIVVEEVL